MGHVHEPRAVPGALQQQLAEILGAHATMILEEGNRRVSVLGDEPAATYQVDVIRSAELHPGSTVGTPRRAAIEVERRVSGHPQRALLGASFVPRDAPIVAVRIELSGEMVSGAAVTCPSNLAGPLVPGLPTEFADAVLAGLADAAVLGPGELLLDRAAHDESASTETAFRNAAELLAIVLMEGVSANGEAEIRRRMRAWE